MVECSLESAVKCLIGLVSDVYLESERLVIEQGKIQKIIRESSFHPALNHLLPTSPAVPLVFEYTEWPQVRQIPEILLK